MSRRATISLNRTTTSNVGLEMSATNELDIISPPQSPVYDAPAKQKQKVATSVKMGSRKGTTQPEHSKFDSAILNVIKEDESADALFCRSLIPTLENLPPRDIYIIKVIYMVAKPPCSI